ALDGELHHALVFRAQTRDAARNDLAALGNEVFEALRIFVIDLRGLITAVAAATAARAPSGAIAGIFIESFEIVTRVAVFHVSSSAAPPSKSPSNSSSSSRSKPEPEDACWGSSTRPSKRSIETSGSSSAGGSTASNLTFAGLISTLAASMPL